MKHTRFSIVFFILAIMLFQSCGKIQKKDSTKAEMNEEKIEKVVNPELFLTNDANHTIATVDCTLSNGTKTKCYKIITVGITPNDHEVGPWCPEYTSDGADKGGIWFNPLYALENLLQLTATSKYNA